MLPQAANAFTDHELTSHPYRKSTGRKIARHPFNRILPRRCQVRQTIGASETLIFLAMNAMIGQEIDPVQIQIAKICRHPRQMVRPIVDSRNQWKTDDSGRPAATIRLRLSKMPALDTPV